ncbi:HMG-Y-related protein A [Musa acuminata AAA Group]|uniref:HMG-Y-related protein A n=1 Tax=Musa acuminata AAA Group TaxID=214697 RepID=UPI0031E2B182
MAAADEEASKTYPEMITEAIEALNDKNGSNKSAISKYMESKYGELPPAHSSLLTAHLARMKESGELLFVKNNYIRPGADAPPKRGRGRPPKPKPALPPVADLPSPRPRGRPPKPKDPLAAAVAKATAGLPRPRGRPPKVARPAVSVTAAPAAAAAAAGGVVKRGRGRPPKVKPSLVTEAA